MLLRFQGAPILTLIRLFRLMLTPFSSHGPSVLQFAATPPLAKRKLPIPAPLASRRGLCDAHRLAQRSRLTDPPNPKQFIPLPASRSNARLQIHNHSCNTVPAV